MLGSIIEFAAALSFTIISAPLGNWAVGKPAQRSLYLGLSSGAMADLWLASSLVVLLWRHRTGFRRTDSLLRLLILYCVNTALITSLCEIASLITFTIMPNNFIYYALFTLLPKLLFNSLLATYNARRGMREMAHGSNSLISIPSANAVNGRTVNLGIDTSPQTIDIRAQKSIKSGHGASTQT